MKRLFQLAVALVLASATSFAGDPCLSGSDCSNACPLARQANGRLATGHEAVPLSPTVRAGYVKVILANLEAI